MELMNDPLASIPFLSTKQSNHILTILLLRQGETSVLNVHRRTGSKSSGKG